EAEKFFIRDEQGHGYDPNGPEGEYVVVRNAGSGEGLAKAIREHSGHRALLEFDELRHLIEKVKIEGSSLLSILTTLHERNVWNNVTLRKDSLRLDGVGLSVLAASTFDNFTLMFGSRESDQGLLNRFWFVPARSDRHMAVPGQYTRAYYELKRRLHDRLALISEERREPLLARPHPRAKKTFEKWYATLDKNNPCFTRLDTYTLRIAMLLAVCEGEIHPERGRDKARVLITEEVMDAALALAEWQMKVRTQFWPDV